MEKRMMNVADDSLGDEEEEEEEDEELVDDEDEEEEEEAERPAKRSKMRETTVGEEEEDDDDHDDDDDELVDDDDDDNDDDDDDDEEEYRNEQYNKWGRISPNVVKKPPPTASEESDKSAPKSGGSKPKVDDEEVNESNKHLYAVLPGYGEHKRAVSSVKFAPGRLMKKDRPTAAICASSSADGYIKLWNVQQPGDGERSGDNSLLEPTVTCGGHTRGINDIAWNPISPFLASASDDKTVRLWDMLTGDALVEYRGHDSFVFCVDQYQHMIVSGSFDETVKLWDIRSGDCVSTLPAHSDPVTSVSFNRDGTVVCTASHDGLIRLWDVATGECLKTIYAAGNPPVCNAKFCPNSKYILAGTLMDATLRLWPVNRSGSNLCAKTYKSEFHTNVKYSIVADFTCDGNIVTGSETGKVILYDLQSQIVLQVLDCHEDAVLAVSAHDKLPLLASGAMMNDRRVCFWAPRSFQFKRVL